MPRVSEITEDGGDPTLAATFAKEREIFGDLLNPTKVMAHCPPILRAAKLLGRFDRAVGAAAQGAAATDLSQGRVDQRLPVLN